MKLLSKNKILIEIIILNVFIISYYISILFQMDASVNDATLFFAADANDYKEMMEWLKGNCKTEYTQIRPLLYPLLIFIPYQLFGAIGVWLLQFILWMASINLIYFCIKKLTRKHFFAVIGVAIILGNLSYIAMTMHALTEVTTLFLISYLLYVFIFNISEILEPKIFIQVVFIFVILTLIKPLFFIPTLFLLGVVFPFFYLKKFISSPKKLILLLLTLTPLLAQMTFVKIKHDHFSVSTIGSHTFKYYYFVEGMSEIENTPRPDIEEKIKDYETKDQLEYILSNKKHYIELLFRTIENNIKGLPIFVRMNDQNKSMVNYMLEYNYRAFYIHKFFLILFFPTLLFLFLYKKDFKENLFVFLSLGFLNYYIILSSGISFWQGDRLTLPSLMISIVQYLFTLYVVLEFTNQQWQKYKTKKHTNT